MLTRFISWLVVRFLTNYDLLKLVSDRLMTKGCDRIVMQNLYSVHDDNRKGDIDHKSFNVLCLDNLLDKFSPGQLCSLIYLTTLKKEGVVCRDPDCDDFGRLLKEIEAAVAEKNYLKRQTNVKELLRKELPMLDDSDINILTTVAINCNYPAETAENSIRLL